MDNQDLIHQIARSLEGGAVIPYLGPNMLSLCSDSQVPGLWVQLQGLSQSEHFGQWTGAYAADGTPVAELASNPGRLLYKPLGSHGPAGNYLVSNSDYVEVLTEIDIQTPIPAAVQAWRSGRNFLFLGCRFDDQLTRSFARQIMKRSSDLHWAVLPNTPTRMEARFLAEQNITRIAIPLAEFVGLLVPALQPALACQAIPGEDAVTVELLK